MSRDERAALREAVDRAVRARVDWDDRERCQGCGGELVDDFGRADTMHVLGCNTCADRIFQQARRAEERERLTVQLALPVAA